MGERAGEYRRGEFTAVGVCAASRPGLHGDGATLYLVVAPGGSKSWIQRVTVAGRRRDIGLGGYPAASLAKADRVAIADGIDPLAEKRRANTPTFRAAATATFEANRPRWRSAKTARAWMQSLESASGWRSRVPRPRQRPGAVGVSSNGRSGTAGGRRGCRRSAR